MKITNFTVSYAFDTSPSYGRKSSNFMSVTISLPDPVEFDQFESIRLEASKRVTMMTIQDAVMRGEMSSDDAKERIEVLKLNFEGMTKAIHKKQEK